MRLLTLHAVRPNEGVVAAYRREIEALVDRMHRELDAAIVNTLIERPALMAQDDATPSVSAADVIRKLRRKWERELNGLAPELAKHFATASKDRSDAQLRNALRKAGFTVDFRLTREINDILAAATVENVSLIKSIPAQYFTQVEGSVMRAMQTGRDLHTLSGELQGIYGVSRRRAVTISRDQGNKATAVINRARQIEVGITTAKWLHSAGGVHPRPSHVAQSGKLYDVREGWYDPDAKAVIWPGTLINCFPGDMTVGLENGLRRLWRSSFNGPVVHIQVGADLLKGTFNHPILTARGWVPMGLVNDGDQIVCMRRDDAHVVDHNKNKGKTTFEQLFETMAVSLGYVSRSRVGFDFHGDVTDGDVDEIVLPDGLLEFYRKAGIFEYGCQFRLSEANAVGGVSDGRVVSHPAPAGGPGLRANRLSIGGRRAGKTYEIGIRASAHDPFAYQNVSDRTGVMSREPQASGDGRASQSFGKIQTTNVAGQSLPVPAGLGIKSDGPEAFAQFISIAANRDGGVFEFGSRRYEFRTASNKSVRNWSGHIFTCETDTGYFSVGGASVQAKNCRCVSVAVLPSAIEARPVPVAA